MSTTLREQTHMPPIENPGPTFLTYGLQVGTGGAATIDYLRARGSKGYGSPQFDLDQETRPSYRVPASPAEHLEHIRSVLRPAVSDLAKALGVSRQAIYDWQAGRPIAAENVARLQDLSRAADLFEGAGLQVTIHVMRRPIREGKNFFEIVRNGASAEAAATSLIEIARREQQQRDQLKARLTDRVGPTQPDMQDLGTPMLDEEG